MTYTIEEIIEAMKRYVLKPGRIKSNEKIFKRSYRLEI